MTIGAPTVTCLLRVCGIHGAHGNAVLSVTVGLVNQFISILAAGQKSHTAEMSDKNNNSTNK